MKNEVQTANFQRFFVHMPQYLSQWLRTKYMPGGSSVQPIRLPWMTHPAGRIVYERAVPNAAMRKLTPSCYSSQMFCMEADSIPPELRSLYPPDEKRKEYTAIALPVPHYYMGRWIDANEMMQLTREDVRKFIDILTEELYGDIDKFWSDYKLQWKIDKKKTRPHFYDAMLDFMELFCIDAYWCDALYRAINRRNLAIKRAKEQAASSSEAEPTQDILGTEEDIMSEEEEKTDTLNTPETNEQLIITFV